MRDRGTGVCIVRGYGADSAGPGGAACRDERGEAARARIGVRRGGGNGVGGKGPRRRANGVRGRVTRTLAAPRTRDPARPPARPSFPAQVLSVVRACRPLAQRLTRYILRYITYIYVSHYS